MYVYITTKLIILSVLNIIFKTAHYKKVKFTAVLIGI